MKYQTCFCLFFRNRAPDNFYKKKKKAETIILEDINLSQTSEQSATMNRRTVLFSYRQLHDAIVRQGQRQGLNYKQVNPAYTSWIGQLKLAGDSRQWYLVPIVKGHHTHLQWLQGSSH